MRLEHERREWAEIDANVFRAITSADWRRELARARATRNAISKRIQERILALGLGQSRPQGLTTEKTEAKL